jgi:hypothetical protein
MRLGYVAAIALLPVEQSCLQPRLDLDDISMTALHRA